MKKTKTFTLNGGENGFYRADDNNDLSICADAMRFLLGLDSKQSSPHRVEVTYCSHWLPFANRISNPRSYIFRITKWYLEQKSFVNICGQRSYLTTLQKKEWHVLAKPFYLKVKVIKS